MSRKSKKKAPPYDAEQSAILKSAGISHKQKHAFGTVKAVEAVNPSQRDRVRRVSTQERVVKGSEGRIDTSRAAIVSPLAKCLHGLPFESLSGLELYHSVYFAAMPSGTLDYAAAATGSRGDVDRPIKDPRYARLAALERNIGPKATKAAQWAVTLPEGRELPQGSLALAMASLAGKRIWDWDDG